MRMKIRDATVGMSTANVPKFARTSAGFEDSDRSNNAVLCKLQESGKVSWDDVSDAADSAAEEAGLPPLNNNRSDITIAQF